MSDITPTFHGEVQLAGWSETHNGGAKLTFWLPDSSDLDVFRALTVRKGNTAGQRFAIVLVEIGEDEQPVPPPESAAPTRYEAQRRIAEEPPKPKGGELAKLAGMWCADAEFWQFLSDRYRAKCWSADEAAAIVRRVCKIESRAELDHDPMAGSLFHGEIRQPFMRWKQGVR